MSVGQAAELRGKLIEAEASLRVVKNTLTQRAADKAGNENLKALLEGPTALTFVNGDIAVAAKVIADFRRVNELPQFKGGSMGGDALSAEQLDAIAKLPSRDVLNAQLASTVASPIIGLVRGLNALIAGIAIQLQAIADQGLVSGTDPEPEPESGAPSAEGAADETPAAEEAAEAAEGTPAEPQATPDEQPPETEAETPAEPEAEAAPEPEAEAPAEPEAAAEETPAEETPSEAPGDPVAEAEAAEEDTSEETPSEGDQEETQEG
jgi:large subunit ribosomal protein L10